MAHDEDTPDVVGRLLLVEKEMAEKMSVLHADHQELQSVDYDADARLLRPYLDKWMDWHLWASYWLTQAKVARWVAQQDFRESWDRAVSNTREMDLAQVVVYHNSYEERKVYYNTRTRKSRESLELLERLVDVTYSFVLALKTVTEHWDKRRVDTKWETDRMSRLPGSDYRN